MLASAHIPTMPSTSCLCHSNSQLLAFSLCPRISSELPRLRLGTHLQECVPCAFDSNGASSRHTVFFFGRHCSSAGQQNEIVEGGDGNSIGILEGQEGEAEASSSSLIDVLVERIGKSKRRITATISIEAPLEVVWNILTDYEGLTKFLPGLAVCEVQDQWENGARLFQIGEQNLAFGVKFRARGVVNVHEHPVEVLPCGIRRDVDFEMIEGDFKIFKGTWRMEQNSSNTLEMLELPISGSATSLTYKVDVEPEFWLPVALVEGRLSKEIQTNLVCIGAEALRCHTASQAD